MKEFSSKHLTSCTLEFLKKLIALYESNKISLSLFEECSKIKIRFLEQQLINSIQCGEYSESLEEVLKKSHQILTPDCSLQ